MGRFLRGLVGLILGTVVGLLLVRLLSDTLFEKGHVLPGEVEVIIVFFVALVGATAGDLAGSRRDRD